MEEKKGVAKLGWLVQGARARGGDLAPQYWVGAAAGGVGGVGGRRGRRRQGGAHGWWVGLGWVGGGGAA